MCDIVVYVVALPPYNAQRVVDSILIQDNHLRDLKYQIWVPHPIPEPSCILNLRNFYFIYYSVFILHKYVYMLGFDERNAIITANISNFKMKTWSKYEIE